MSTTTGSSRGGGGHGASVEIPASTKKVVQDLKEVVGNSEEEIYAMLKECNMDPNETAQRLLNQGDPFHEVKRKRDKRKEGGAVKEVTDVRGRPGSGGNYGRGGGRSGGGRGSSLPRFGSQEQGAGRGRSYGRENGSYINSRGSSAVPNSSSAIGAASSKPSPAVPTSVPSSAPAHAAAAPQAQSVSSGSGGSTGLANGSSVYVRPAPAPQGAWASGHGTMADLLKARAAPPPNFPAFPSAQSNASPSYPAAAPSIQSSEASEFYSSSADPVLESSVDSGNQRPIGSSATSVETSLGSEVGAGAQVSSPEVSSVAEATSAAETADVEAQVEAVVQRVASPPPAFAAAASEDADVEETTSSTESQQQSGGLSALGGSQFNGRPLYAPPQQPVGTQKVSGGVGLEWKAKAPGLQSSDGGSQAVGPVDPTMLVQSYQAMSLQDDEPVIIPTHFRVPEGERSHLSFGSFGTDFNTGFGSFGLEEMEKPKHVETIAAEEDDVEEVAPASVETQVEMGQYGHQQGSAAAEDMSGSVETLSVAHPAPVVAAQEQHNKADAGVQQSPNYFLGGTASNYPGFGLQMPQMPSGQYLYEQAESQGQDVSRIPSMVPAYDPTTSYYTSAFRGQDADRLYPPYVATNASSKYGGNVGLMAASSVPSSQEVVSPMMVSSGPSAAPSSQAGSNVQSAQTMPQQVVPTMHYAQQPHSVPYGGNQYLGYQYIPPTYPYIQPPYGHHMYNSSNNAYVQPQGQSSYPPTTVSTFLPTAGSSYQSGGSAAAKFPIPQPHYKPVAGVGSAPHSAPGMGYPPYVSNSGYASGSPAVTASNSAVYEDVSTSHVYKDSTLYVPSQQPGDSSTVWIQAPMGRDMGPVGGIQASSYYNLASQGQHSGYAHTQQPTHGHGHGHAHPNAAYANLYHPSQTAPAASHQMLQQPQGMGGGASNTQGGAYQQQTQRTQQTWNNSNY